MPLNPVVVAKVIAVASTGIHTGTTLSMATFIVPSVARLPAEQALATWISMFHAAAGQALGALALSTLAGSYLYMQTANPYVLAGVTALSATVPYTLLRIDWINKKLIKANGANEAGPQTQQLLQSWGKAHRGRVILSMTSLGLIAFGIIVA